MDPARNGGPHQVRPSRHVLLVEGDVARRQHVYDTLTRHGCHVSAAPSSEVAVRLLQSERPDLILTGAVLNDAMGRDFIQQIRAFDAETPILFLADDTAPGDAADGVPGAQACLPRALPDDLLVAQVNLWMNHPSALAPAARGTEVLVVDDDQRLRELVREFLELNGFAVSQAGTGEQALRILEWSAPQAVLLDLQMPGMDGLLALKKIRARHPGLPVIVMTHADDEKSREEAAALGVTTYLVKPLNFTHLKELLAAGGR
jgi:DNA-binding response OmpR family regulator